MRAKLGDTVSPYAIERITMAKGQQMVVSILPCDIHIATIHYMPGVGMGYFWCFGGECCEDLGDPSVKYGIPIVIYPTDSKNIIDLKGELIWDKMLSLGFTDYNKIITHNEVLQSQNSNIYKKNVLVKCVDSNFQKRDFYVLDDCAWPKMSTKEIMQEHINTFLSKGERTFGRKIDEDEYNEWKKAETGRPIEDRDRIAQTNLPSNNVIITDDAFNELLGNGSDNKEVDISSEDKLPTVSSNDGVPF